MVSSEVSFEVSSEVQTMSYGEASSNIDHLSLEQSRSRERGIGLHCKECLCDQHTSVLCVAFFCVDRGGGGIIS